ncbi:hypothetical protein PV08_07981 [Exophiala spinifera]|uniref:AB hydrolase-1 domain-containing protein n=1 Tax=Exophiala spinifera TaxID=91928 RepID=A0A0D2BNU4_9EURO|nr:uncharacterized protein PV08_07981 [Exophiala spinifera]KIW12794.1 hypothetical protein PV08_07981 [Exophiala spinifera]
MASKPPLPPRTPSALSSSSALSEEDADTGAPRAGSQFLSPDSSLLKNSLYRGGFHDPRASSTQSLRPAESAGKGRRTLLIVYIHGFLGDETSFKSFPAHIHGSLTERLRDTHVVYTKIYPRYKSRRNISFAANDFSKWLAPHESDNTDVILVGHSLGGILAAEVVLLRADATSSEEQSKHRILGLLAFDVPYLGMHPGVVGTGIASIFRTSPTAAEAAEESLPLPEPANPDPTYNPSYPNDVRLATRKGKLQRAWYFWNKHAGEVTKAAGKYVSSHLEFGGCLADYVGLRKRYRSIRELEDVNELATPPGPHGQQRRRVRFVNYYTSSTGPVKSKPESRTTAENMLEPPGEVSQPADSGTSSRRSSSQNLPLPSTPSPRISLEEHRDGEVVAKDVPDLGINPHSTVVDALPSMGHLESLPSSSGHASIQDTDQRAVCDVGGKGLSTADDDAASAAKDKAPGNQKERRFCVIPSRNSDGRTDSTWIKVQMDGIDEVQAHTSMFTMGATYIAMVEDTVRRIEDWVQEDASRRMILAERDSPTWE